MRCKVKTTNTLNLSTGEMTFVKSETVNEPCGVPLFSTDNTEVCKSCLSGWEVEGNRILKTDENAELLSKYAS